MARILLSLALAFSTSAALARPPDEVPRSPIPPLKEPVRSKIKRAAPPTPSRTTEEEPKTQWPISPQKPSAPLGIKIRPKKQATPPRENTNDVPEGETPEEYSSDPKVIWNSPKMREARWFIMDYSHRAVGTSPKEGEKFLQRLSQLPADQMRDWLTRYEQRRVNIMVERSLERMARQMMLDQAISQQEAIRQAYANVSQLKAEAAEAIRLRAEQLAAEKWLAGRELRPTEAGPAYDPMYPSFDPARRLAEDLLLGVPIEQAAAAASLPGDLPPEDPRNFERGEEGADFVETQE